MEIQTKKNFDNVGLRIVLVQKSSHCNENSNVVFAKSRLKYSPRFVSKTSTSRSRARSIDFCYLKSCYLCAKKFGVDKDIYMYRGDRGFCSVECRSKQIEIDEKRDIEESIKHTLASIRYHRITTTRCDAQADRDRENRAIFL